MRNYKVSPNLRASLRKANIVVLAHSYNPSIVSPDWVLERKILNEPINDFVHTQAFSLMQNNNFSLVVDTNRLQLSAKKLDSDNIKLMPQILHRFFTFLPETPCRAMGFNFTYELKVRHDLLKDVLSPKKQTIEKLFASEYKLGAIIHFEFEECFFVRVNISPMRQKENIQVVNFNFHTIINKAIIAKERLNLYEKILQKMERIQKWI